MEAAHRRPRLPRAQRPTPPARSPPRPRAARSPPPAPRTHSPPSSSSSSSSAATPRARRAIWASPSSSTSTHSPLGLIPPLLSPLRSGPPCPLPACLPAALRRGAAADRLARRSEAAPPRKARARATNGSRAASRAPPPSSRNRFAAAGDERDRPKRRAHAPPCAKLDACSEVPLPHWLPGLHQPPVATRFRRSRPGSGGGGGGERWRGGREAGLPPPRARSHIALRDWRAAASGRAQGGAGEGTGRCQRAVAACEEAPRARGGVGLVSRGGVAWRGVGVPLVARGRPGGR